MRITRSSSPYRLAITIICLSMTVSACKERERMDVTQVAAKVNGSEISVHQINTVLSRLQGVNAESSEKLHKEVLEKLIDQQLVYDKAVDQNLDRNPEVMMMVDAAKREVIARAYMEKVLSKQVKVSDQDIHQYFEANPSLFANRRVYDLQEIVMEARPELLDTLKHMAASGKPMDEFAKYLKGQKVKFTQGAEVRPAEQVPFDFLPKLAESSEGKTDVFERDHNYYIVGIRSVHSVPLSEATARAQIIGFLRNQRAQQATKEEVGRLKRTAKIEYLGEFAKTSELNPEKSLSANGADKSIVGLK